MPRRRLAGCAALAVLTCAVAACAGAGSPGFWEALQIQTQEVDRPESLAELIEKSAAVIAGEIVGVVVGPADEYGPDMPIAVLQIQVAEVLDGTVDGDLVEVIVARDPLVTVEDLAEHVPTGTVVLFVQPAEGQYWVTSSQLGIVAEAEDGTMETVLQPELSEVVLEPDVTEVDEFAEVVEGTVEEAVGQE
jgi:hypothetical protein